MARIATVHLLIDVGEDAEACDFCSETFSGMPGLLDWVHACPDVAEVTVDYSVDASTYAEGDFNATAYAIPLS